MSVRQAVTSARFQTRRRRSERAAKLVTAQMVYRRAYSAYLRETKVFRCHDVGVRGCCTSRCWIRWPDTQVRHAAAGSAAAHIDDAVAVARVINPRRIGDPPLAE
jgi:hypothetical protein